MSPHKHRASRPPRSRTRMIIILLAITLLLIAVAVALLVFLDRTSNPGDGKIIVPSRPSPTASGWHTPKIVTSVLDAERAMSVCRDAMAKEFLDRDHFTGSAAKATISRVDVDGAWFKGPGFEVNGIVHYTLSQGKTSITDVLGLTCDVYAKQDKTLNVKVANQPNWEPNAHA